MIIAVDTPPNSGSKINLLYVTKHNDFRFPSDIL